MWLVRRLWPPIIFVTFVAPLALEDYLLTVPGNTSPSRVFAIIGTNMLTVLVTMTFLMGVSARLGTARVRPRKWIRRLFRIPDDYRPTPPR